MIRYGPWCCNGSTHSLCLLSGWRYLGTGPCPPSERKNDRYGRRVGVISGSTKALESQLWQPRSRRWLIDPLRVLSPTARPQDARKSPKPLSPLAIAGTLPVIYACLDPSFSRFPTKYNLRQRLKAELPLREANHHVVAMASQLGLAHQISEMKAALKKRPYGKLHVQFNCPFFLECGF